MRIIAEIPHPICKISLFAMNQKYIIKFELGTYEQVYKVAEMDLLTGNVDEVKELLDDEFLDKVIKRFEGMRLDFITTYKKHQ